MSGIVEGSTSDPDEILVREDDALTGYSAVFEDDGRVAYAYLLDGDEIVADVWLYNRGPAPPEPEWRDPSRMPFANPEGFASVERLAPAADESEVGFRWRHSTEGAVASLDVLLRGEVVGRLKPGSKPGWAKLAARDGPLARVLEDGDNR